MHIIKNEYLHVSKNEYLHENNQNLNKNGYGNNVKSIRLSLIKCKSVAFPFRVNIFDLVSHWNCKFVSDIETDCGLISTPTA